jgi:hypothetical protein
VATQSVATTAIAVFVALLGQPPGVYKYQTAQESIPEAPCQCLTDNGQLDIIHTSAFLLRYFSAY